MSDLLQEAIAGLGINVPIYRTEEQNDTLVLYLYGGRVVRWPPSPPSPPSPSPVRGEKGEGGRGGEVEVDDLTVIPGVGKATAAALNKAGFHTFRSLINADDADILAVPKLNTYTLGKIRSYLYVHFL